MFLAAAVLSIGVARGALVINEIHYDPADKTSPSEFVELYNAGETTVALGGWRLSGGIAYAFPVLSWLDAGQYLVIAQDAAEFARVFGFAPDGQWDDGKRLSNHGETISLRNASNDVEDTVSYGVGFPWPTAAQGDGPSMELVNPAADNDLGGSWRSSAAGPTPRARNSVYLDNPPPCVRHVDHGKDTRPVGTATLVTVKVTDPDGVASVALDYQVVAPGDYVAGDDARYAAEWTRVAMHDDGLAGDTAATDSVYSVVLDAALHVHRRLIRYRIVAADARGRAATAPYADDPQPNFAYFVYGAMPAWTGAARPGVTPPVTYGTNLLQSLPVCCLLTKRQDHLDALHVPYRWGEADEQDPLTAAYGGLEYPWQGTLIYEGKVYDHVHYRARGGGWRYAMGKNMWKFDFNRGHELQAHDDYGRAYDATWDKLNLSAIIQQGNFGQRGEQGLFEAAGFRLHDLAGNAACRTHFTHFRIVEGADEAGPDAFSGDFQGLYLAIEQMDGNFLDQHGLADGNLYKMEGGTGTLNNQGVTQPGDRSDLDAFMDTYESASPGADWWKANLDLENYYSFRAIAMAIHDYDIHAGKNYFYYHNPEDGRWSVHNWDLDLCWTTTYNGGGGVGPLNAYVFRIPEFVIGYNNRLRELRDLLFNPEQTGMLLDEIARVVYTPGEPSFVDADRAMWDYNPILVSSYVNTDKAGHGRFYGASPTHDFDGMIAIMKSYVATRMAAIDPIVPSDDNLAPSTPTVAYAGAAGYPVNRLRFAASAYSGGQADFAAMRWRIAEVSLPTAPEFDPTKPRDYEIGATWESGELTNYAATIVIPSDNLNVGHRYRTRVRMKDTNGRWSHWSSPVTFVTGIPDNSGDLIQYLALDELMFDPPTGSEYEFVELVNRSDSATLSLGGVRLTEGIEYVFPAEAALPPGGRVLIVRGSPAGDFADFRAHYGLGGDVAIYGPYEGKLDNSGEEVRLRTAASGDDIVTFTYETGRGWPLAAAGAGHSLVPLVTAGQNGLLDYGGNWRASACIGGSPGRADPELPRAVVLNEIIAHTDFADPLYPDYDSNDRIELHNRAATNVTLTDWYLSDEGDELTKWRIPDGTVVAAGGEIVFDELRGFHSPITSGFGLNKNGEQVFLSYLPGTVADRVVDCVAFKGQMNGASWGHYADGTPYWQAMSATAGEANARPAPPVVIEEIMYHPACDDESGDDDDEGEGEGENAEYIELHNVCATNITLWTSAGSWRIAGDVDYVFPAGTTIPAGGYLVVVGFDPEDAESCRAFAARYGLTNAEVRLAGPYEGRLSNHGARVALEHPQDPDLPDTTISWVIVDEVIYYDRAPWPVAPDGEGAPLERVAAWRAGNDPSNWMAGLAPSPGTEAPAAVVAWPRQGATVLVPSDVMMLVQLDANAVSGRVNGVEFFADGTSLGVDTESPYEHSLAGVTDVGPHRLGAAFSDDAGIHAVREVDVVVSGVENVGASNGVPGSVELSGRLTAGGRATAFICWGVADGGTHAATWEHVEAIGDVTGVFSTVVGGLVANADYSYRCYASGACGTAWAPSTASFDTPPPEVSVGDVTVVEGSGVPTAARFAVTLNVPSATAVLVDYATADGTAAAPADYLARSGTLPIAAGRTAAFVDVPVASDLLAEPGGEEFFFELHRADGAVIARARGCCAIEDDDIDAPATDAPVIAAVYGALDVAQTTATLTARLTSTGSTTTAVWLYWGETDGGHTPAAWEHARALGTVTKAPDVDFFEPVNGLVPSTYYHFAYRAGNGAGDCWTGGAFATAGAPGVTNTGVSGVALRRTVLGGALSTPGDADVMVYWGSRDGGTNAADWAHGEALGTVAGDTAPFAVALTNLLYGIRYYYRCHAVNEHGAAWAPATTPFGTTRTDAPPYAAGLRAGSVSGNIDLTTPNPGTSTNMGPAIATQKGNWASTTTYIYSGEIYFNGGTYCFVESIDDKVWLAIDGVVCINNSSWSDTTTSGLIVKPAGWYPFELRMSQGGGGSGWVNIQPGFQYNTNGLDSKADADNVYPEDDGRMSLFRHACDGSSPDPPLGIANLPADGVSYEAAELRAALTASGAVYHVTAFWGRVNGGTTETWECSAPVGAYTNVVSTGLTYRLGQLAPNTTYFYSFRATNVVETVWGGNSLSFVTDVAPPVRVLQVRSAHGSPVPCVGLHTNVDGTVMTNTVNAVDTRGATQCVCRGWSLTGMNPSFGTGNVMIATASNDAVLTWLWRTNYMLTANADDHGRVQPVEGWLPRGSTSDVLAVADPHYRFAGWRGTWVSSNNPLRGVVTGPLEQTAHFEAVLATNGTPCWWLASYGLTNGTWDDLALTDADGDGMATWMEWTAGTDPTNAASVFAARCGVSVPGGLLELRWPCATGRSYRVLCSTNVTGTFIPLGEPMMCTPGTNVFAIPVDPLGRRFYRIGVQYP